ncbi:aminotransferase class I/II-fold pyridoxal phosphate-dependent enzyme [Enterocloster sp.]|jgi:arginine decarboxylase|uniref:aminotransferase class I/II-fold pyridoxal phosphate-dependent enzyme n=1 Tax=Enterocloster sp. TaxID=2719315 RepID=UPI002579A2A5|nr:aminotransferase class I/II-fold pyridoxal phosphate-dependent enzyme [Enterocloster sp.]MBS5405425.1 aminotransferase class I/II-fold pyridoxal phosphate-dependent enzyme [Enterocloster sp.]
MRQEELLINRLAAYARSDMYPFHMPGHKRRTGPEESFMNSCTDSFTNPFAVDITEIEGFDNLHHPEGILKDSMKWAADVYGADQTYYLINGSTGGILAAVCGSVPRGGRILVSRNCHKSVYHGICLNQLKTSYVYPQEIEGLGIQGGITAEDVERMLNRYMDTQAVLIVCPTYDGIVSDIEAIARIVHRAGLPLIVDEAHGAHFRYDAMFPVSALDLGADVVIQSVHKTLPSLTQTALLHIKCNRPDGGCYADRERIDRYIHMVQSSSPSYVLMASIENSIYQMEQTDTAPYGKQLYRLRRRLGQMRHLRLADTGLIGQAGIRDLDISKIVVSTRGTCLYPAEDGLTGFTGAQLDDILRREYHLEMEMCGADYVTAITTVMDSGEGLERLGDALTRIDTQLTDAGYKPDGRSGNQKSVYSMRCDTAMSMGEAMEEKMASVGLEDSAGCISGEFVYIYPPGIPIVAPGEWISRPILEVILEYRDKGLPVQGPADQSLRTIRVVQKD